MLRRKMGLVFLFAILFSALNSNADIVTNLTAYYPFDGDAQDHSGNGYHGTVNGATFGPGQVNSCAVFDGVNDYIDLGTFDLTGVAVTLTAWVYADRFDTPNSDPRVVSKAFGTNQQDHYWMMGFSTQTASSAVLRFRLKVGGTTYQLESGAVSNNTWHHITVRYNGSMIENLVDGVSQGTVGATGLINQDPGTAVWAGGNPSGVGDRPFDGKLDELRIYERYLTDNEIQNELMTFTGTSAPFLSPGIAIILGILLSLVAIIVLVRR